eukprot:gene27882-36728_t
MWVPGYGCAMNLPVGNFISRSAPTSQPANMPTIAPNMAFDLTYHYLGGVITGSRDRPVLLHNIFLGDFNPGTVSLMNYFSKHLSPSPWFNTLTSYYNLGNGGPTNPVFVSDKVYLGSNLTFSTDQIRQTLQTSTN